MDKGAKAVVLASHLGRPDGSVAARLQLAAAGWFTLVHPSAEVPKFSMAPVAKVLEDSC